MHEMKVFISARCSSEVTACDPPLLHGFGLNLYLLFFFFVRKVLPLARLVRAKVHKTTPVLF